MIQISPAELLDRISILEIKSERIADPAKLENIQRELRALRVTWGASSLSKRNIGDQIQNLKRVNEEIWVAEDRIRAKESAHDFGPAFVELARRIYFANDRRASTKRGINLTLGSLIVEEKSHAGL